MNPIQKQLLVYGVAVILAMLIFPPWTKITHRAVMALDRSTALTETQTFAGYSFLFSPPPAHGLAAYQTMLMPGEYYESVEIDFGLLFMQWLTAAFLTAAGLLYFKGSDKKSLKEWWSSVITPAKPGPPSNPLKATPPDSPISETQVPTDVGSNKASESTPPSRMSPWKRADKAFGIGCFVGIASVYQGNRNNPDLSSSERMLMAGILGVVCGLVAYLFAVVYYAGKGKLEVTAQTDPTKARNVTRLIWVGVIGLYAFLWLIEKNKETKTAQENPNSSVVSQVEKSNNAADAKAQAAAQFRKDFFDKYPDLIPYESVVDDVAAKLQASGYKGESREAVMETFAKAARNELANQIATEAERKAAEEKEKARAEMELAAKGGTVGLLRMGERYRDGDGVPKDMDKARDYFTKAVLRLDQDQATNGDASAQYSLGLDYLNGQGCETNREQAIYWLQKAAEQGNLEASNKLVSLQK